MSHGGKKNKLKEKQLDPFTSNRALKGMTRSLKSQENHGDGLQNPILNVVSSVQLANRRIDVSGWVGSNFVRVCL